MPAAPVAQYTGAIRTALGYRATWLPGDPLAVGDVGVIVNDVFEKRTSAKSLGLSLTTQLGSPAVFSYQSANDVQWTLKAKGELSAAVPSVAQGKAGAKISFGKSGSVVFQLEGARVRQIADRVALESLMWDLWQRYMWDKDWVVVTEIVSAPSATILIAAAGNAAVELEASAKGTAQVGKGVISAGVGLVSSYGMYTTYVSDGGLTPLYKAIGFKSGPFTGPKIITRAARAEGEALGEPMRRDTERPSGTLTEEK